MKVESESEAAQSCPTLNDPMDCSLPGSSVHGIFQARVLEWGAIAFSRGHYNGHHLRRSWLCFLPNFWRLTFKRTGSYATEFSLNLFIASLYKQEVLRWPQKHIQERDQNRWNTGTIAMMSILLESPIKTDTATKISKQNSHRQHP